MIESAFLEWKERFDRVFEDNAVTRNIVAGMQASYTAETQRLYEKLEDLCRVIKEQNNISATVVELQERIDKKRVIIETLSKSELDLERELAIHKSIISEIKRDLKGGRLMLLLNIIPLIILIFLLSYHLYFDK